ncbi:PREDICTED: protein SPA1-RELATED 3-like isoform X2 [Nelumbo nucifera]|uniref:Protein SPA1-RELATED 3-like isoform X2 n=1 Tax=Nelumbo nucifera TaxID=4432 RepID=A0A1U8A018_NELNU|nr:PREDICTED: protein SPA1-RELATED 3-like isoform X2 [Nelumbo nucifera]
MVMEGSSESGWEKTDSSRELNTCAVSSGSLGLFSGSRLRFSGDASNNVKYMPGGKERDRVLLTRTNHLDNQVGSSGVCGRAVAVDSIVHPLERGEVSLRHWLDNPERSVDLLECLHIFRQIVETVNLAHSQGIVVHNVRPSCFVMSSYNRVSFIESASCSSSGSDSFDDTFNSQTVGGWCSSSPLTQELNCQIGRVGSGDSIMEVSQEGTSQRASETSCLRSSSAYATRLSSIEEREENKIEDNKKFENATEHKKTFPLKQILLVESNWYTSPEEVAGAPSSFASDIYRLGVLLFELFCTFSSMEEKLRTMSNLRHRVLPPQLLLKYPKEASFCLWLLHPQPSPRPKMSEVLQSEFLNEPRCNLEDREAAIKLREEIEEHELLLEFLLNIQQRKQEVANRLHDTICCLSADIEEVLKQQKILKKKGNLYLDLNRDDHSALEKLDDPSFHLIRDEDSANLASRKRFRSGIQIPNDEEFSEPVDEAQKSENQERLLSRSSRLMKNFKKLESAYFSTRCKLIKPTGKPVARCSPISSGGRGSIVMTEGSSVDNLASKEGHGASQKSEWISPFLEGLCKYLSFSKLKVRADLKQGDLLNSSNLVCSLGFDRDREFFATAGVNRKIKIFECDMILNEDRDIHYPVIEMASRSKLSSICWNGYIKNQIASSDFEGVVQVWDVTRSQVLMEMREHERRVWSVDFSLADPTRLASGSDDGAIKLWNINQVGSIGTIKTKANVCSVQFPPDSARSLAIGSADHRIYCYDLRNTRVPLCTLIGHNKTVSYVKFIDSMTLVSASTDNTLKLWDLSACTSRVIDSPLQTFTGHTNIKNFVGLSVSDGYIVTGSETNEVFIYHKAFPMPVLSFKFGSTDPLSGHEVDDASQFISSVCWRGQSSTLVAANSTGNIKLLEMV